MANMARRSGGPPRKMSGKKTPAKPTLPRKKKVAAGKKTVAAGKTVAAVKTVTAGKTVTGGKRLPQLERKRCRRGAKSGKPFRKAGSMLLQ
jgi:hypothetical protein